MACDCKEKIENCRKRLAKCMNLLEAIHDDVKFIFEQNPDWYNGIQYQLEDSVVGLGFALATLTNWYDEEGEKEE